jgi:micrococcal nuclease
MSDKIIPYSYKINVTRVIDGDTIDCLIDLGFKISIKSRIRLAGIDTPESRTSNKEEKVYGLEAKERLECLLNESEVKLISHGLGKFGRVLGTLYVDDIDVNQRLIDEGFAIEYQGSTKITTEELINRLNEVRSVCNGS